MKYTIETKFGPGQKVWFMKNDLICSDIIQSIYEITFKPKDNSTVEYFTLLHHSGFSFNTNTVFKSRSELIKAISE